MPSLEERFQDAISTIVTEMRPDDSYTTPAERALRDMVPYVVSSPSEEYPLGMRFDFGKYSIALTTGFNVLIRSPNSIGEIVAEFLEDPARALRAGRKEDPIVVESTNSKLKERSEFGWGAAQSAVNEGYTVLVRQPKKTA